MTNEISKKALYDFCCSYAERRISSIQLQIQELNEALISETKSSAGDKHETGRAMIQLEREKLGLQLLEAEKMKKVISRISLEKKAPLISLGSLAFTDKANYFLGISAGEYKTEDSQSVFCISMQTPIGKLLCGKSEGDHILFRGEKIKIIKTA